MSPPRVQGYSYLQSFPRMRGDEPGAYRGFASWVAFSPHARG